MAEDTSLMNKPKKLWNDALRMVKGEDSARLIEQFTAEMTLVAEGLCEDQNQLRNEVSRIAQEEDRRLQKQESRLNELEVMLEEQQRENDRIITELRNRLAALEKQSVRAEKEREREQLQKGKKSRNTIRDITVLVVVAAVAVIAVCLVLKFV